MIIDGVSAADAPQNSSAAERAVTSFLKFIEKKLDVSIVRDVRTLNSDSSLSAPLLLAKKLREYGIIKDFGRSLNTLPDEPRTKSWYAVCNDPTSHAVGGTTWENDTAALYATLAEALERYLWFIQDDYFVDPLRATVEEIAKRGSFVGPKSITGFSEEQRKGQPDRKLEDAEYLWMAGTSLVTGARTYVPAQTVSPRLRGKEPMIRQSTSNGLATWPTLAGARLAGALELVERDAFMSMWLNQLTLPRIPLSSLCARYPEIARITATCEKYRLKMHVIPLLTDAPTHAIAVVLEDMSDEVPRFAIGLRAHRSLSFAIQKAATEALRARRFTRTGLATQDPWDPNTPAQKIGHRDRLYYWAVPEHAQELEFLIKGPAAEAEAAQWDNDDEEQHLRRVLDWCLEKKLECISVSLGTSSKNPTPWHIEMVVMPQLQPMYLAESLQAFGGTRWKDVPKALGYTPLKKPFAQRPHPFS